MATPVDIASLLLEMEPSGRMDAARLHKLLYYVQAWSLAQCDQVAFSGPIKAWVNGPVVPSIYGLTRGRYTVNSSLLSDGNSASVTDGTRVIVNDVCQHYGKRSTDFLIALAHFERPWIDARRKSGDSPEITKESMRSYFKGRTPASIEADYHMHVAASVEHDYDEALRLLAQ